MPQEPKVHNQSTVSEEEDIPFAPAYFLSLTIENIRSFGPRQTLDLSDKSGRAAPWTIILGDNGFGKTTLLQCLALLQPRLNPTRLGRVVTKPVYMDQSDYFLEKLPRSYPCSLECSVSFGAKLTSSAPINIFNDLMLNPLSSDSFRYGVAEVDKGENVIGLICYGYGAARRMGGGGALTVGPTWNTTASLFSEDTPLINAEEWYLQADYSAHRSPSAKTEKQREQIKEVLIKILPDVQDIRVAEPSKGSKSFVRMEVRTPFGWVHIQDLSLGYRTLIAWVVDLAHHLFERYPKSRNPLKEPAVVLVDEIDLHLHPRFQRILMDYLTDIFPNTQFIATAHSPLVVQAASNANLALLRREGDHVVIDNDVEAIKNWRVDQILTSDLFGLDTARPPQLDPLMEERTRILSKARLTKADKARLEQLETQIGDLPTGETPADIEAMDVIREAARLLKNGQGRNDQD